MSVRRVALVVSVIAAVLVAAVIPARAAKSYRAERFHTRIVVEPGGAVVVTETLRFEFGSDSFTYVYRDLPTRKTDGVDILAASMDGVPMERGKAAGQFEVKREDNRRRVVWHFPATANAVHTFSVTYRASGVVWQDAERDVLAWTLLPTKHEYGIECASGEVEYPATTQALGNARFDPPAAEVQVEGRAVRFLRCPFERDQSWVMEMDFAPRSVAATPPGWQRRSMLNRENTPLFLALGGLILVAGVGGFMLFALNHRHRPIESAGAASSPPDGLRPALAGALVSTGATAGWGPVLAAIMDLARRGALTMQSVEKTGLLKSHEVRISQGQAPVDAAPHERVLLDLLFTDKHGPRASVTFSELAKTFASSRRWKGLREAISADLRAERLLDGDRERTRARVTVTGLVILLSSFAGFIGSVALFDRLGEPVLMIPIATLIVGIVGLITGATISPLSEEGHRRAEHWRAFKRSIADTSDASSSAVPSAERVERWLPYAVAFGTAVAWMKRLQKQGVTMGPSWLSAVSREGGVGPANIGATVAILSAGSSAGAHAGGHAGGAAGAAGGGASGAG
jgi:hypothetical protein